MDINEIKSKLIELLPPLFTKHIDVDVLDYEDFIDDYGVDSLTFITIVIEIENTFGITMPDDMLTMEYYRTLDSMAQIVQAAMKENENAHNGVKDT